MCTVGCCGDTRALVDEATLSLILKQALLQDGRHAADGGHLTREEPRPQQREQLVQNHSKQP